MSFVAGLLFYHYNIVALIISGSFEHNLIAKQSGSACATMIALDSPMIHFNNSRIHPSNAMICLSSITTNSSNVVIYSNSLGFMFLTLDGNISYQIVHSVVPTTTPPLVLPYNGKNKGAPTKFLNPTPMEGWI